MQTIAALKFAAIACLVSVLVSVSHTWTTSMASISFFPMLSALILLL
jgi:hypothetical protein